MASDHKTIGDALDHLVSGLTTGVKTVTKDQESELSDPRLWKVVLTGFVISLLVSIVTGIFVALYDKEDGSAIVGFGIGMVVFVLGMAITMIVRSIVADLTGHARAEVEQMGAEMLFNRR